MPCREVHIGSQGLAAGASRLGLMELADITVDNRNTIPRSRIPGFRHRIRNSLFWRSLHSFRSKVLHLLPKPGSVSPSQNQILRLLLTGVHIRHRFVTRFFVDRTFLIEEGCALIVKTKPDVCNLFGNEVGMAGSMDRSVNLVPDATNRITTGFAMLFRNARKSSGE
jgi:hypothetical protein